MFKKACVQGFFLGNFLEAFGNKGERLTIFKSA
jgi:hypothetical protein